MDRLSRSYDEAWGAVETSRSGNVVLTLDGREYEAQTRTDCLLKLTERLGPHVDGPGDPVWMRRYHLAYYRRKIERYMMLREQVAALRRNQTWGVRDDETPRPRDEALAIIDEKLARFAQIVADRQAEDRT